MQGACAAVVTAFTITASIDVTILVGGVAVAMTALCTRAAQPTPGTAQLIDQGLPREDK